MIDKIIIGIAFSPNLEANLFEAIRLSITFNAELICVHVGSKDSMKESKLNEVLLKTDLPEKGIKTIWKEGKPVATILSIAQKHKVDLLVLGALQKENIYKYYVGSIARKLTRKAPCSVLLLIKPSIMRVPCKHIVVNGLLDEKTEETIKGAFEVSSKLGCKRLTVVEEISQNELKVKVNDDKSLKRATLVKEHLTNRENLRVKNILNKINTDGITVKTQSIFGKRGYSIGHYAKVKRADLLIMNAPKRTGIIDRIFPHDLEYILYELPTDILIIK
ncbi:Nucleotide-binding universal stress protein, UspA family [Tenacibaculum sp. MAR_2009_124]|uniref:universal stress protein n=1 Tax=Tenacibaculum sp. MAR_2009_124 TaxID=1250059 RepID=UPI00089512FE|nr:universal stress protein [Tenacibaculum sp. MAR_2009_124]SEB51110.1 Nucleotide-binding universal stress protein, UspA family [Tenacibaculum sp. MAR_2009_124]